MSKNFSLPENEKERLEALIIFSILDKMPEEVFHTIAQTAAIICRTQAAIISFFEGEKHHIKSSVGLNIYDLRNDFEFCHKILQNNTFIEIKDASLDAELMQSPMVIGHPNFRFFAGVPIYTSNGFTIGTICVVDTAPSQLNKDQIEGLQNIAKQIQQILDLKKQNKNLQTELNHLLHERTNQTEIDLDAYKFALDQSSGVAIADKNGYIKFANDKFCRSSGYIKEEILGQSYNILNSKHHSSSFFKEMWEVILNGELWHGEIRNKDKQGNFFWVDCSIIPFLDKKGKPYQFMSIQQDITEKKSAQERMTLETRLISILSENEPIDKSILHISEQICYRLEWDIGIYWNIDIVNNMLSPTMYYQFTYPHNDELKTYLLESRIKKGEGLPGRVYEKKKPSWVYDLDYESHNTELILYSRFNFRSALLFPILFNNEVIGIMEFISARHKKPDINIIQMFESTGLQIGAFIERKTAEQELLKAKKQAEESVISKDQFLANMSHEIRTPMNAIIGFTELLSKTNLSEQQKEYAGSVKVAGENLLSIINDILDFSKIESGVITVEALPSDIRQIMKNIFDLLKISARQKSLEFDYQIDENIPEILICDALRLNQILINLVGNAIKFTEKGSVLFSASLTDYAENIFRVKFSVKDTGIGIHDEKKEKIFERFTQVNNEINRKYEGTGLGLSISKNLIELLGGNLELKSEEGIGSEFFFSLWLESGVKSDVIQEELSGLKNKQNFRQPKILVIEDNILNQKLAKNVLQNFGFDVELAMNGQIGLEMLKHNKYDLILMDLQMPELDGYQTTRMIRNIMRLSTPIIAMTAHSIVGEKEKCLAVGMNDFISKPFNPEELYHKIISKLSSDFFDNSNPLVKLEVKVKKHLNLKYLSELSDGNHTFETEMIELFIKQVPIDIVTLSNAVVIQDEKKISDLSHKLKSSLDIFGRQDLSEELNKLSNLYKSDNKNKEIQNKLEEIQNELELFYPVLNSFLLQLQKSK